jgi:hypothetical protein
MKLQRLTLALTAINLLLLLAAMTPARTPANDPILRGRMLELVDDKGQVRSSIKVETDGEVVLRMFDKNGTIRVKLGADKDGSGLLLADETTEPGVHLVARRVGTDERRTTRITLIGADGKQRVIEP